MWTKDSNGNWYLLGQEIVSETPTCESVWKKSNGQWLLDVLDLGQILKNTQNK